jgi:hypothetical protein
MLLSMNVLGYALVFTLLMAPAPAVAAPAAERLTVDRLKALKPTSNDPEGDVFVDSHEHLDALVDAFVADNALASPTYLYLAANTAFRLGRLEDAAFLFYAAQLRKAVDLKRYDIDSVANGNNTATYFAFLNQTIGAHINPAITRQPKLFAAAIQRIDAWTLLPAPQAYYPEFEEAKGFRLARDEWPRVATQTKEEFMVQFGRKYATLLNDPAFFEAFQFVQAFNQAEIDGSTTANQERYRKSVKTMQAIEARLSRRKAQ